MSTSCPAADEHTPANTSEHAASACGGHCSPQREHGEAHRGVMETFDLRAALCWVSCSPARVDSRPPRRPPAVAARAGSVWSPPHVRCVRTWRAVSLQPPVRALRAPFHLSGESDLAE